MSPFDWNWIVFVIPAKFTALRALTTSWRVMCDAPSVLARLFITSMITFVASYDSPEYVPTAKPASALNAETNDASAEFVVRSWHGQLISVPAATDVPAPET